MTWVIETGRSSFMFVIRLITFASIFLSSCSSSPIDTQNELDVLEYVDPFICTEGDNGQLYPGPAHPFGMVHLSPETDGKSHVGYYYEDEFIEGFSHLRVGGAGSRGKGGGILIKPGIGKFTPNIDEFQERYDKTKEEAAAGYYTLTLESGVKAELTVSERVGFHRYSFPDQKRSDRYVVLDLSHSYVGMQDASLRIENKKEIIGMIQAQHNNKGDYHKLYFAMLLDQPFESAITWDSPDNYGPANEREGKNIGAWLKLPEHSKNKLLIKVGLSPVSVEQAVKEAKGEIAHWDFDKARSELASKWNEVLSKIELEGGSEEHKTLLYTHLYHSYLVPNIASASNGDYRPANQPDSLFNTASTADDFTYYSTWSLWDDFRKYSLVSILEPQTMKNIALSLVDYYKNRVNGDPSYWPTPNIRMEFTSHVIMDAYKKGLVDIDLEVAFKGMKEDYAKYDGHNVSSRLEKAYHAGAALEMAKILGRQEEAKSLKKAAEEYKELWCEEQADDQGNSRGFFTPEGEVVPSAEDFEKYVYEGNLWHYRWWVLHDIQGLSELRGGHDKLADDLEYFFENDFYMHLNEPDFHYPYLFNVHGKPYLTQKWVRTFTTKEVTQLYHNHGVFEKPFVGRIYRTDPKGYIKSMDDDTGAMSSWFVMSAMGLFQIDMLKPVYQIGSPIFPKMTLHLGKGKTFEIIAHNVSEENYYIQSAKLNGNPFENSSIDYETIMKGGSLEFEMGAEPNKNWAASKG